ncbi:UDP-N-acetylmuramoyl-tripeptide--D-alanyl-D-alanine ligase [Luteolibacter ambystomatis]|uniref:UDP-N-acetylmuramoyl-tripeptide--D-alanyl-D-alanine ligase n=1 Tax=Luteolibacter ambystomatis TaxID=2824561 RepID=A0A975IYE5_9BACT|nr:UDP-N-acetylmuramoyl-tripeptide--D-alanyl-D-alanine ligase [Luteolibacter ambystomatis]QUE49798.1 UDP-N-acetylmuramoyl-tripeptide--D-alanyl-D-alanine ligase [Luteolibacter ambystomatis]
MRTITVSQLAEILGTSVAAGSGEARVSSGVSTDTRTLPVGSAFFALRGERFDGHRFTDVALNAGATALVVDQWEGEAPENAGVVVVPDTLAALQRLAFWWRSQLDIPVIGITGSNGKTSTKDFAASILSRHFKVSATKGNLNNHIGVPLTVLSTAEDTGAAVWEMGMNHSGEIAPLCEIARPKFGIITNIGTAHIEYLGSREGIAEEKGMLARSLPSDGTLFLPAGCDFYEYFRQRTKAHVIPVGNGRGLIRAENLELGDGSSRFKLVIEGEAPADVLLPVAGRHMVTNALLAAGAAWKVGLSPEEIAAGLSATVLTGGRLRRIEWNGITLFDDTYNANPESMAAALETLADTPVVNGARRIAVLGRMAEQGEHAPAAHRRTGELAARRGITVIAVGDGAEEIAGAAENGRHFRDVESAAGWLSSACHPGDVVLFKGSRSAAIERVMNSAFPRP